jgi:signal transduction histidine kinase
MNVVRSNSLLSRCLRLHSARHDAAPRGPDVHNGMPAFLGTPPIALWIEEKRMHNDAPEFAVGIPAKGFDRAMEKERRRLAREVHDGVLQSLTAVALQLEALASFIEHNPDGARQQLRVLGDMLAEEQRELRMWLQAMTTARGAETAGGDLAPLLNRLCRRMEVQWDFRVELRVRTEIPIPAELVQQIYRLLQEALNNAGRHAIAKDVRVDAVAHDAHVQLVVRDDGHGFPFHGRYDLSALRARRLGPWSLIERVSSLGGELVLDSTLSGSRLEFALPVHAHGFQHA